MSYFEFKNHTKIVSGENAVLHLDKEIYSAGGRKVFLIVDKNIQKLPACKSVKVTIQGNPTLSIGAMYNNIEGAITISSINEMYEIYRVNGCDSVVACGGGAVIDAAKCLVSLLATQARNIYDSVGINSAIRNKKIPFGVVNTTVNGGCQLGKYVTVKDEFLNKTIYIESDIMIPDFCIVDPKLTMTLPSEAIVKSAVGILAYCFDVFIGKQSSIITRDYVKCALQKLKTATMQLRTGNDGISARQNLMEASVLCGIAYTNSMVGMTQSIARALNSLYGCDFLGCVCAVMKKCLLFNFETSEKDYAQMFMYVADKELYASTPLDKCAIGLLEYVDKEVEELKTKYFLPITLSELNVPNGDIDKIASEVMQNYAVLSNARVCDFESVKAILIDCFSEV